MIKRQNGHQVPNLTQAELDKKFSDILASLLQDGYTFIYSMTDRYDPAPISSHWGRQVKLEKDGNFFGLIEVKKLITIKGKYYTQKHYKKISTILVTLSEEQKYRHAWDDNEEALIEQAAVTLYHSYYSVTVKPTVFGNDELVYYYTAEEPAKVIAEKRLKRSEYKKWRKEKIVMEVHLDKTPYKNFRKNVTVIVRENAQTMINQNGKEASIRKSPRGLYSYDLKRA